MTRYYSILVLLVYLFPLVYCISDGKDIRDQRLISTFQVVRFPNDNCVGSNTKNGTCYTSQECSNKGGSSSGSCADGFGVCCVFTINTCGSSTSEYLTVWTQPTTVSNGACSLLVNTISDDICSLRLDFTNFVITGPSTMSLVQVRRRLGHPINNLEDALGTLEGSTFTTNCFADIFYSTSPSPSSTPPSLCGTLTGEHMYVEADIDRGNLLQFNIGDVTLATQVSNTRGITTAATRTWDITISQIECTSPVVPPTGCTKYWWGSGRATLKNYNHFTTQGSTHLAMQHERMCIRRERGNCIGCFFAPPTDFAISWQNAEGFSFTTPYGCCGYQTIEAVNTAETAGEVIKAGHGDGANSQFGWDCVIIPGAFIPVSTTIGTTIAVQTNAILLQIMSKSPTAAVAPQPSGPQICGGGPIDSTGGGLTGGKAILSIMGATSAGGIIVAAGSIVELTVCTRNVPFTLEFMSDDLEGAGAISEFANANQQWNRGFKITHDQLACST